MSGGKNLEARFERACDAFFGELLPGEALSLEFGGEDSTFLRFNRSKVRQVGSVERAELAATYYRDGRTVATSLELGGSPDGGFDSDREKVALALGRLRRESALLPPDPYQTLPSSTERSRESFSGRLPAPEGLVEELLSPAAAIEAAGAEFVGLHSQGQVARGAATSSGARHWFSTETFATDYSAYLPNGKAVKSCYAGREWDGAEYRRRLESERPKLEAMGRPERVLKPGAYRVYIAPDALAEFMVFFSWNGLSERELREGESAWTALREGRKTLSPKFRLEQDFGLGVEPRFNELGEVAPAKLPLIEGGRLVGSFVSARTAKQYGVASNASPEGEYLRSASVAAGDLDSAKALEALGMGLYLSNLHYLNWSDNDSARVTGMTRFACVWVEGGKIVAPIKDLRFDESLFELWGGKLEAVSRERSLVTETGSYGLRGLGGAMLPGMLVRDFTFTL